MSATTASFLMPDAAPTWQLWKTLNSGNPVPVEFPSECRQNGKPLVVGLPATACRTVGLVLPEVTADLLPSMIEAQLEKRGFTIVAPPQANYAWHLLGAQHGQMFVSVDVLGHPFPQELIVPHAVNYAAALRMRQLPADELVIVQEQDQIVLAFGQQGKLWHSHIIGSTATAAEDLAREIRLAQMVLENTATASPILGIELVGQHLAQLKPALQASLKLPLKTAAHLEASRQVKMEPGQKLLPLAVYDAQKRQVRKRQVTLAALVLAVLYTVLFLFGWMYISRIEAEKAALQARINDTGGPAASVRTTAQRWRALEPATDVQRYPMVQLSQITSLMPPSGILIKKFTAELAEVEIDGDARDAQSATQFLEDLKKHPQLGRYAWSMPVPAVRNNVATFKIQGTLQ